MTTRGVFRWLWRFNAVVIAGVCVIGLILGAFGLYETVKYAFRDRNVDTLARVATSDGDVAEPKTVLTLGHFSQVTGSNVFWAPISAKQSYTYRLASKAAHSTRNFVFYDPSAGSTRRLFESDRFIITSSQELKRQDDASQGRRWRTEVLLFVVARADSNGDGVLNSRDRMDVVLARPDGTGVVTLARDIDSLHGTAMLDTNRSMVIYNRAGRTTAHHFDTTTLKAVKEDQLHRHDGS